MYHFRGKQAIVAGAVIVVGLLILAGITNMVRGQMTPIAPGPIVSDSPLSGM